MNRSLVLSSFAVALIASCGAVASANTVVISLDLFYSDGDADLFVDAAAQGSWQLTATSDEEGLAALATQITGIAGLDATTNRPIFEANASITAAPAFETFKSTFDDDGVIKPWDTDSDGSPATLEMLFGQVPLEVGPQELTYDVGKVGGTTPNTDELGDSAFLSVLGASMTDGVFLAYGVFGAGSSVALNPDITPPAGTGANVFLAEGIGMDPPLVGEIVSAGTLTLQTRTNVGVRAGDINLDGFVNAIDAGTMFANWNTGSLWQEGDVSGDLAVNAIDAGAMFASWSPDPGPADPGVAIADYDPATGEIIISIDGVNNWFIQSASGGLTGDEPNLTTIPGSLPTNDDSIIGETAFGVATATSVVLGNVAAPGLALGDLTISWNAGLGIPLQTAVVQFVPEPATLVLAAFGLCGVLATRRRVSTQRVA